MVCSYLRMVGKNHRLCHSCRCKGHFFADWQKKRLCQWRKRAFVKYIEMEKENKNKGRLFNCCSVWEWVRDVETSCKLSVDRATSTNGISNDQL